MASDPLREAAEQLVGNRTEVLTYDQHVMVLQMIEQFGRLAIEETRRYFNDEPIEPQEWEELAGRILSRLERTK